MASLPALDRLTDISVSAVIGSVNGQITTVFTKLNALHAKNAFAFAIIVGHLFADQEHSNQELDEQLTDLLAGKVEVALPTYFVLGKRSLPEAVIEKLSANAGEICPNLYFLGRRTTIKTSEGVKIVALGGARTDATPDKASISEYTPLHTQQDVSVLRGANTADILLTSDWPADIRVGSKAQYTGEDPGSERGVSDLCAVLKPRYHFSTSHGFFEREPFFHAQNEDSVGFQTTRFLSLAPFGNASKQKWIYAFSLDLSSVLPQTVPAGTTASPLSQPVKKRKALEPQSFSRFGDGETGRPRGNKRARAPPQPRECFFCLSNPNIASHLITSIGNSSYLTTSKGPLPTPTTFKSLGFPGHILIIPLEHSPTLEAIQDAESKRDTLAEMHKYRDALQKMVAEKSASGPEAHKLGAVTFEISRAGGVHVHWQFMPVPKDLITRGLVEAAFKVEAENEKYPAFETGALSKDIVTEGDYFRAILWSGDGEKEKSLTLPLYASFRFDLQFGRRVLGKLLGLESRSHWQDCGQSEAEEIMDAEAFKEAFKSYDFSLED